MSLNPGARLGPYEVVAPLGAGGMGEVYRARDTRLDRDVALKILPEIFASDPDRLARFEREAKLLAALNHPHIAAIYGIEHSTADAAPSRRALVLELVEGETLADVIARGPLAMEDALPIGRQIAEALEAAHDQGIIHRDLKPANVKITPIGTVKVLDFGLGKLADPSASHVSSAPDAASLSPTITNPALMTGAGMLLGTAAYMPPEQAKGRPASKRSDIWAFGCVLYEMLTGRRAFEGDDVSDTIAAVLRAQPEWTLPADVPPAVAALLRACLQKDPRRRPGDAAALVFAIDHAAELGTRASDSPVPAAARRPWLLPAALVATLIVGAALALGTRQWLTTPPVPVVTRFEVHPPPGTVFPGANGIPRFAVSPDGQRIAFEAGPSQTGPFQLWLRRLDALEAEPLKQTSAATETSVQGVFWFANGRSLGYFDELGNKLKRVDLQTGAVQNIADIEGAQLGGTANGEGVVLFSSAVTNGIRRVSGSGGPPVQLTTLDQGRKELRHLWPRFLPDGQHFLYFSQANSPDEVGVYIASLDKPRGTLLVASPGMAEFAPPDRLLYVRGDTLLAQRLDLGRLALVGEPSIVAQPVFVTGQGGRAGFSVSNNGVLVHTAGGGMFNDLSATALTWIDRTGKEQPMGLPPRSYGTMSVSPDGKRIAVDVRDQEYDVWIADPQRATLTRLTFDEALDGLPVWTPDSQRLVYASAVNGSANLFVIAADGTGAPQRLTQAPSDQFPSSISPDGTILLFDENQGGDSGTDIQMLRLGESRPVQTLVSGVRPQRFGTISPDGRWIAYQSAESFQNEIYVRTYPDVNRGRWQVSTNGGTRPRWSRDGKELFYVAATTLSGSLMTVDVPAGDTWTAGSPRLLFSHRSLAATLPYDVAPDGRFVMLRAPNEAPPVSGVQATPPTAHLTVVVNWIDELNRLAGAN